MRFPPLWKSFESKNSPEFPNCDHTRRIHPWKSVPLKRREKRRCCFALVLLEIRSLLFYKFPLSFFFRRMKMKRKYLSMNKRGEVVKGDKKKKKEKYNARHSVFDTIATRSAGGMSFSANLPSPPPPTLGAAGNHSARSVIDSELLHTTFVRASRCNRVMTENCVITQFIRSGGERSI